MKRRAVRSVVLVGILLGLSIVFFAGVSLAAPADFPKKEITIVVNYGPGGGRDILARGIGNAMSKYLGVPFVILNQPGAGGARGLTGLFHLPPDGYTIGVGSGSDITNQIFEKIQEYDNRKFSYIGRAQSSPSLFFVKSDSPFHAVKDFKTFGKTIRHSSFSITANHSVAGMIIANRDNFPLVIVSGYKSAADTALAVMRGEAEFAGLLSSSAAQYVRAGQIRPIVAVGDKRTPDHPNTPTVGEIGHPDLAVFTTDFWFMAPPGVPKDRMKILEDALMKTLKDPDFRKWAEQADVDINPLGGEEMAVRAAKLFDLLQQYKSDIERYMK